MDFEKVVIKKYRRKYVYYKKIIRIYKKIWNK